MDTPDRRRHSRRAIDKPCKLYHPASRRYAPARALNISEGGALVAVEGWCRLNPGDAVDVLIAWKDSAILPAGAMVRGRVIRAEADGSGRQALGIRFNQALSQAAAA